MRTKNWTSRSSPAGRGTALLAANAGCTASAIAIVIEAAASQRTIAPACAGAGRQAHVEFIYTPPSKQFDKTINELHSECALHHASAPLPGVGAFDTRASSPTCATRSG